MVAIYNPYLTAGSGTSFTSSSNNRLTFYNVQNESIRKNSGLTELPMPIADSDDKILTDLMGASREIVVEGEVTTDDVSDLRKYARDLVGIKATSDTLIYGNQGNTGNSQVGYFYASEMLNRGLTTSFELIRVYVTEATVYSDKGNPNALRYSVTMMECSVNSV